MTTMYCTECNSPINVSPTMAPSSWRECLCSACSADPAIVARATTRAADAAPPQERTKARWGEPPPTPNGGPSMHDLLIADIQSRKQFGLTKYGTILQANNGRDALQDAYEEAIDLIVYLRQAIEERRQQAVMADPLHNADAAAAEYMARTVAGAEVGELRSQAAHPDLVGLEWSNAAAAELHRRHTAALPPVSNEMRWHPGTGMQMQMVEAPLGVEVELTEEPS